MATASARALHFACRWRRMVALWMLLLPSCFPLPFSDVESILQQRGLSKGCQPWGSSHRLSRACMTLRGGSMPGFGGLGMEAMDKIMTPDMIRAAANTMSQLDPNVLNSMMSMSGMPAGMGFDAAETQRAAAKLKQMTPDEIRALKNGALTSPLPGLGWSAESEGLLRRAEAMKQDGNDLHTRMEYEAAVDKYAAAKKDLTSILQYPKAASLARSCSLNEASCHLQLKNWKRVEELCSSVLASDRRNLKALYRRGLAYKRQAEDVKDEGGAGADGLGEDGSAIGRGKALLVSAYKDVGAARMLNQSDVLVDATFEEIKGQMEALDLDWAGIALDLPALTGCWGAYGQVGCGMEVGRQVSHATPATTALVRARETLARDVNNKTSYVREGARVLAQLDSDLRQELLVGVLAADPSAGAARVRALEVAKGAGAMQEIQELEDMSDDKIKHEIKVLQQESARQEREEQEAAPAMSINDLPRITPSDPLADWFGSLGGLGGNHPNVNKDGEDNKAKSNSKSNKALMDPFATHPFASLFGGGGMAGANPLGCAGNPFVGMGGANPFGGPGGGGLLGGAGGGGNPFGGDGLAGLMGNGSNDSSSSPIASTIETLKQLWMLFTWVRGVYKRLQRVLPFLTIGFIQRMMTLRWFLKKFVLPKYGGTYTSTCLALAPKVEQAARFVIGGHVITALRNVVDRAALELQDLRSPESKGGGRFAMLLAAVAALVAREVLGFFVRVISDANPYKKML